MNNSMLAVVLLLHLPVVAMETIDDQKKVNHLSFAALQHLLDNFGQKKGMVSFEPNELEYIFQLANQKSQRILPANLQQIVVNPSKFCSEQDEQMILTIKNRLMKREVEEMSILFRTAMPNRSEIPTPERDSEEMHMQVNERQEGIIINDDDVDWIRVKKLERRYHPYLTPY